MAFTPESTKIPSGIGNIVVILKDAVEVEVIGGTLELAYQSAHYQLVVEFDDDSAKQRRGDLVPHITPAERTMLMDFMDTLRARADAQILPS